MKGTSPTRSGLWPARHRSAKIEFRIFNLITRGEVMEKITTVGIDLAKSVFSLHGVDGAGQVVLRRTVRRDQLVKVVAGIAPCLIGMEACSGAHEWGRRFQGLGHTVKLMAPKFVAPYRKSGKNDGNDAEAICEAVTRPSMRFVPVKSVEQQALLAMHRVRQGFVVERTATINRLRGLLCEFGVVLPLRSVTVRRQAAAAPGSHQQARRRLPQEPARAGSTLCSEFGQRTPGPHVALDPRATAAPRLLPHARGDCQQERAYRLGAACQERITALGMNASIR